MEWLIFFTGMLTAYVIFLSEKYRVKSRYNSDKYEDLRDLYYEQNLIKAKSTICDYMSNCDMPNYDYMSNYGYVPNFESMPNYGYIFDNIDLKIKDKDTDKIQDEINENIRTNKLMDDNEVKVQWNTSKIKGKSK